MRVGGGGRAAAASRPPVVRQALPRCLCGAAPKCDGRQRPQVGAQDGPASPCEHGVGCRRVTAVEAAQPPRQGPGYRRHSKTCVCWLVEWFFPGVLIRG